MSDRTANFQTREEEEHRSVNGVEAKATAPYGFDGTNLVPLKVNSDGTLNVTGGSSGAITNDGTFAKETGGNLATIAGKDFATQTTLALIKAKTDNIDVALSTRLKPADTLTKVTTVDTITNPVAVTGAFFQTTQPVSAASLPLPTGAATGTKQDTGNASLSSIDGKLSGTLTTAGTATTTELTGLVPKIYDYISANFAGSTADVYTYKAGGSGGSTAATLTVNWTDSTKTVLSTVVRT